MKSEAVYEIAYTTPNGRHGRKVVRQSKIVATCQNLQDKGYYGIQVSYYPICVENY